MMERIFWAILVLICGSTYILGKRSVSIEKHLEDIISILSNHSKKEDLNTK